MINLEEFYNSLPEIDGKRFVYDMNGHGYGIIKVGSSLYVKIEGELYNIVPSSTSTSCSTCAYDCIECIEICNVCGSIVEASDGSTTDPDYLLIWAEYIEEEN